jgi:hypothetical protein
MVVRGSEAARFALEFHHEINFLAKRAASLHLTLTLPVILNGAPAE